MDQDLCDDEDVDTSDDYYLDSTDTYYLGMIGADPCDDYWDELAVSN
jgi:hypothetical protein